MNKNKVTYRERILPEIAFWMQSAFILYNYDGLV